ncbi:hypothetical protein HMPREF1141_0902 [Clostridium sp. MSTE9]|nr:hypothetical protein HMPREF1141_0902 [Clostridium sp. MSTE9]
MSLESWENASSESLLNLIVPVGGRTTRNRSSTGRFLLGAENNLHSANCCWKKHGLIRCFSSSEQ